MGQLAPVPKRASHRKATAAFRFRLDSLLRTHPHKAFPVVYFTLVCVFVPERLLFPTVVSSLSHRSHPKRHALNRGIPQRPKQET